MGDFNDTPDDTSIREILDAHPDSKSMPVRFRFHAYETSDECFSYPSLPSIQNLFAKNRSVPPGSHKYQGEWSQLDQIILSSSLTDTTSQMQLIPGSARIFSSPSFPAHKKINLAWRTPFPHLLWLQIRRWLQRPSPFDRRLSTIEINDYFCFFKYR
ncbi:MAG: hypothetical protein ACLR6J_19870 [Parabacteroides merdae]